MAASRPVVNSSAKMMTGSESNSVAKDTLLFSPPDKPVVVRYKPKFQSWSFWTGSDGRFLTSNKAPLSTKHRIFNVFKIDCLQQFVDSFQFTFSANTCITTQ